MKKYCKKITSVLLVLVMCLGMIPTASALQDTNYRDPAAHWQSSEDRTSELDTNAVVTHETFFCCVCEKHTSFLVFRVPEYTRDGVSALTRNVLYSDGTMVGGVGTGRILDGTPGKDAVYSGYHWTKAVCETCGTIGSNTSLVSYAFNKNIYGLYDCAANFMEKLPETKTYEYVDDTQHRVTTTSGEFCMFCFGTRKSTTSALERHALETEVIPQPANGRFAAIEQCSLCDYKEYDYTAAKAVVASYFGVADGKPHTITVSDLSEAGVTASIRYGNSANSCSMTTAPSYTEEGQYTVYYDITYAYKGKTMSENGVAYVWLRDESAPEPEKIPCKCGCGLEDCNCGAKSGDCGCGKSGCCDGSSCGGSCGSSCCGEKCSGEYPHEHSYTLLDSIDPTCLTLGYDRYICLGCGDIEKRDYKAALGHSYQQVLIREATCETDGKVLELCSRCGDMTVTATPKGEHSYKTYTTAATCTSPGYLVKECSVCGDRHISDITPALPHSYKSVVTPATCTAGGRTLHICDGCGSSFVTDYTDPLGHQWDEGTTISSGTCVGSGVIEYKCRRCGSTRLEGDPAKGHAPGTPATCTQPQLCTECGAVITPAPGHTYSAEATPATCLKMGWTTYTCSKCGDSYKSEYTDALGHDYIAAVTEPTCTERGYTTYTCSRCGDSYVDNYTDALDHQWDNGIKITDSSCIGDGVKQYRCSRCGETYLEAVSAKGHTPGSPATCTQPQLCTKCGAVIVPALGHNYADEVTPPTCTEMGYTTHVCGRCGDTYKDNYTDPKGHTPGDWIEDKAPTADDEGERHKECEDCGEKLESESVPRLGRTDITDESGEAEAGGIIVVVTDTDTSRPIMGAYVLIRQDGSISIRLPDRRLLDYSDRTTITVMQAEDRSAVSGVNVAVTDKNGNYSASATDAKGQITVPGTSGKTDGTGRVTVGGTDEGGRRYTVTVIVSDHESGRLIGDAWVNVSSRISVTLPRGEAMDERHRITVTVLNNKLIPQEGLEVVVRSNNGDTAGDVTDDTGKVTVPPIIETETHTAYINGYPDGTFGPERGMTRAEAAAIFARLLAADRGETIRGAAWTVYEDVPAGSWYSGYVRYLSDYGIVTGRTANTFAPDEPITRAEFIVMSVRFSMAVSDGGADIFNRDIFFRDVYSGHWASDYIRDAAMRGWIVGYGDGTMRPDAGITRAEVVTVVNRMLGRSADKDYITSHVRKLDSFRDMPKIHWAYYDVMEAANTHTTVLGDSESWSR